MNELYALESTTGISLPRAPTPPPRKNSSEMQKTDQQLLASGSYDNSVKLWTVDGARSSLLTTLSGHTSDVNALAYIPDQPHSTAPTADT
eukprot:COSAG01_NODE_4116_length_5335_cov_5.918067_1_plen_90_part_00